MFQLCWWNIYYNVGASDNIPFDEAAALVTVGTVRSLGPDIASLKCTLGRTCEVRLSGTGLGFEEPGILRITTNKTNCDDEYVANNIVATGAANVSEVQQSRSEQLMFGIGAAYYALGEIVQGLPMEYGLCWKTTRPDRTTYQPIYANGTNLSNASQVAGGESSIVGYAVKT